jgi:hypothetical protein
MKRIDPQASADERAKKEVEEAERKKQEALNKDQSRRDQALLATYGSEKDVEDMRRRALEDNQRLIGQTEAKIAALKERAAKSPGAGVQDELKQQQDLLETKNKEQQAINAKYDDDRKRYLQLTGRGK